MADIKFGDDERKQVIARLEALKNIKLLPVGNSKKFLKGSDGSHYCIVGGTGDWHDCELVVAAVSGADQRLTPTD